MSEFIPKNIFVVGATGWLGSNVARELLNNKAFNVKLLIRKDAFEKKKDLIESFKNAGATFVEGDISDVSTLAEAMKGSDTVLSTLGGEGLVTGGQFNLLEAAKLAGVRRIVPSEFGSEIEDENDFVLGGKIKLRNAIKASGLEYTIILTGFFYEFFSGPLIGVDLQKHTALLAADGNVRSSITKVSDIAKFVPEILLDPETKNQYVRVFGDTVSYNEAIKIAEEELGAKFTVTYQTKEELLAIVADPSQDFMHRIFTHLKYLVNFHGNQVFDDHFQKKYAAKVNPVSLREYFRSLKQ